MYVRYKLAKLEWTGCTHQPISVAMCHPLWLGLDVTIRTEIWIHVAGSSRLDRTIWLHAFLQSWISAVLSEASAPILQCKASMAAFNAQSQLDPQLAAAVILVHCVADQSCVHHSQRLGRENRRQESFIFYHSVVRVHLTLCLDVKWEIANRPMRLASVPQAVV